MSLTSVEQTSLTSQLLNLIFHRWPFATGQPLMAVGTPTPGLVTPATVAIIPELREAYSTGAPMHHDITTNGVKLKQSVREMSQVTNLFK